MREKLKDPILQMQLGLVVISIVLGIEFLDLPKNTSSVEKNTANIEVLETSIKNTDKMTTTKTFGDK